MKGMKRILAVLMTFVVVVSSLHMTSDVIFAVDKKSTQDPINEEGNLDFVVDIPNNWTNNKLNWISASEEDINIYFKCSRNDKADWGDFADAEEWTESSEILQGEGYIKFWAVKSVDEKNIVDARDSVAYKYDITEPEVYNLKKVEIDDNKYVIQNDVKISDSDSGIKDAYYIINPKNIETSEQIRANGTSVELKISESGYSFSIDLKKEMNNSYVFVYVLDEADNFKVANISIDTYKDLSAPSLTVSGIDNEWVANTNSWNITVSDGAKIYYEVSDKDKGKTWGEHSNTSWTNGQDVNEGKDLYIHFWAAYDDEERAVKEETYKYSLDKTAPQVFGLKKVEVGENEYAIQNDKKITDSGSGIKDAYYIINPENIETPEQIRNNGTAVELKKIENGYSFSIDTIKEMNSSIVCVYVIDNVDNVQIATINIDTYKDLSAPKLSVSGIENKWVTNTRNWRVSTSIGAKVYYTISTEDKGEEWGEHPSTVWNDGQTVSEGEGLYIHFWAAYDDAERAVEEKTYQYSLDNTAPQDFVVELVHTKGYFNNDFHAPQLIINGKKLYDATSGIDMDSLRLRELKKDGTTNDISIAKNNIKFTIEDDNTISFSIDLSKESWLTNKKLEVYVKDNAGIEKTCLVSKEEITYDPVAPLLIKDENAFGVTASQKNDAILLKPYKFNVDKDNKHLYSVYANDKTFIKVTVEDNNLEKIIVTVDGITEKTFTQDGNLKWITDTNETQNKKTYYLKVSDLNLSLKDRHNIVIYVKDAQENTSERVALFNKVGDDNIEYSIIYDPEDEEDSKILVTSGKKAKEIDGKYYYGNNFEDTISIDLKDDNGINNYSIHLYNPNQKEVTTFSCVKDLSDGKLVTIMDEDGVTKKVSYSIPYTSLDTILLTINNTECAIDGEYRLEVMSEDLAANVKNYTYHFYVDTTSPKIVEQKYNTNPSILKYLTFGIWGNDTVDIIVTVEEFGCGIDTDNVLLKWNGKDIIASRADNGVFKFEKLPLGEKGIPHICVADKLGNIANYYFTTEEGKLANQNMITNTTLTLENNPPKIEVVLPEENKHIINGMVWYPGAIDYSVIAADLESGLNNVSIKQDIIKTDGSEELEKEINESGIETESGYVDFVKMTQKYSDEAKYTYQIDKEGAYHLLVNAEDNAGNKFSDGNEGKWYDKLLNIDTRNPEIIDFMFNDKHENELKDAEKGTYGFYFNDDTSVKVFVKDEGVSSGIDYVTLYGRSVDGKEFSKKVYSSDSAYHYIENGGAYAEFIIEKGFKGQVWALVADKVAPANPFESKFVHTSGLKYSDGTIVEDYELHKIVSSIDISENIVTDKTDSNGILLYNTSIPLSIDVKDLFSGISRIEWSIANDETAGIIEIDNNGNYKSDSELALITAELVARDSNLITGLNFNITVSSNTNENEVRIKFVDMAGNESEASKKYSIDTTAPTISATLSNTNPSNEYYYNTDQTITVVITERNFNASGVSCILNGAEQLVGNWTTEGSGDSLQNIGTFTINTDGEYSFRIAFVDMAGNIAEEFTQSKFVIDKTAPAVNTNFYEFNTNGQENYFGRDSINKKAEIVITEHNFSANSTEVIIYKKAPGSEHNMNYMDSQSVNRWTDDGDNHTLSIVFNEHDDGVYYIKVSPTDLALNVAESQQTVVFEIDFTNPVISERNGLAVYDSIETYNNLEVYNEKSGIENGKKPSVSFSDTNFDHLEYNLTVYTPEYKNEKELDKVIPVVDEGNLTNNTYSLPDFEKDGVYSFEVVAVDRAGNRSIISKNTSVLMMNNDVLAYITNSNKELGTGWYSLQKDENTPISKRPDSFKDLGITVFAQDNSVTKLTLRDDNGESNDINISADKMDELYGVGVYNYNIPKSYFVDNYPEGTNKDLYLWAENTVKDETSHITLGWIRIDALAPSCEVPTDLKNWKTYINNEKTIVLKNISESLDESKCIVYDNGVAMSQGKFTYSDDDDTLSYTLNSGWHDISFVLVDEAGNVRTIQEISSIQVGLLYCLWFRILCGVVLLAGIVGIVTMLKKKKTNNG